MHLNLRFMSYTWCEVVCELTSIQKGKGFEKIFSKSDVSRREAIWSYIILNIFWSMCSPNECPVGSLSPTLDSVILNRLLVCYHRICQSLFSENFHQHVSKHTSLHFHSCMFIVFSVITCLWVIISLLLCLL